MSNNSTITISGINKLLEKKGVRQNWLAKQLKITPHYLNYILRGKRKPRTMKTILTEAEKILTN